MNGQEKSDPAMSCWEADERSAAMRFGAGLSQGRGPRGMRASKACAGRRTGEACHTRRTAYGKPQSSASPSDTRGGSRMPESGPYGSVRGALSNERPYRDKEID